MRKSITNLKVHEASKYHETRVGRDSSSQSTMNTTTIGIQLGLFESTRFSLCSILNQLLASRRLSLNSIS